MLNTAIAAYLSGLRCIPPLSIDRAIQLWGQFQAGSQLARKQLIEGNLRLVVKIAQSYKGRANMMDLIQAGNEGLIASLKTFDPSKGAFSTHAAWWIRAYMTKQIENDKIMKACTTSAGRQIFGGIERESRAIAGMGLEPTAERLAKRLYVSEEELTEMQSRFQPVTSIDRKIKSEDGASLGDMLASNDNPADDVLDETEKRAIFDRAIAEVSRDVNGNGRWVMRRRILEGEKLENVGEEIGVTRERVRQIEKDLIEQVKAKVASLVR